MVEVLSKLVYRSLVHVLPRLNFEGLNLAHFLNMSKIDQNKPKLDVNYSNLERNTAKCYIRNERGGSAI